MQKGPGQITHRIRRAVIALSLLFAAPAAADPAATLNQTLDAFSPTAKQTIALRDFLGNRGDQIVPLGTRANGLAYFDLRDAKNARTGQIAVGADAAEGSIFVARVTGPAVFDPAHSAATPRVLNAKMRGAIVALLAGAEAGSHFETISAKSRDVFLRDRPMMALTPQPVAYPDRIIEMEASFFADGSGFFRSLRAPVGLPAAAASAIHVAAKFYPALGADGHKAFREAVLGVDADFTATLAALGNKTPCPATGCAPMALQGELHLTRWQHAVVPSAPANLIAEISPPPPDLPDVLQDGTQTLPPPPSTAPDGSIDATGAPHSN